MTMTDTTVTAYKPVDNWRNYSGDKEMTSVYSVIGLEDGKMIEIMTVRCFIGRSKSASTVYASVWIHGNNGTAGHGQAGGHGYHKKSAAIDSALRSAGIELSESIGGVGDGAIRRALEAVAQYLGFSETLIVNH